VGGGEGLLAKLDGLLVGAAPDLVVIHTATHDVELPIMETLAQAQVTISRIAAAWRTRVVVMGPWGTEPGHPLDRALARGLAGRAAYVSMAPIYAVDDDHLGGDDWHPN